VLLSQQERSAIDATIRSVCRHKKWMIHALNVRTNHIHVVVTAPIAPEQVMNSFKAWATRRLKESGLLPVHPLIWSRHGSTRYLWEQVGLRDAVDYVVNQQDERE
jgi:REP element-mobilizing transposase RayT